MDFFNTHPVPVFPSNVRDARERGNRIFRKACARLASLKSSGESLAVRDDRKSFPSAICLSLAREILPECKHHRDKQTSRNRSQRAQTQFDFRLYTHQKARNFLSRVRFVL